MNLFFGAIIGTIFLVIGIYTRLGYAKQWYLAKGVPVLMPEAMKYIFLPFGLVFIGLEIITSDLVPFELRPNLMLCIWGPLLMFSYALAIIQPTWLLPNWLNYLHKTYGHSGTELLLNEARKDIPAWLEQVKTHEGLVEWAKQNEEKLGYGTYRYRHDSHLSKDE